MKFVWVIVIAAVVIPLRVWMFKRRRNRRNGGSQVPVETEARGDGAVAPSTPTPRRASSFQSVEAALGDVGLVAGREIRERIKGKIFRIGTLVVLVAVAAAIVIPTLHHGSGQSVQTIGVVGGLSPAATELVHAAGSQSQDAIELVTEPSLKVVESALRSNKIDFAIVDADRVLLSLPTTANNSPADATLVKSVADYLGVLRAYRTAGITAAQAAEITGSKPITVQALEHNSKPPIRPLSVFGLVILFVMLSQYNTWILIGVMQEKSSRVVEVLLATVRPIQLLGGKVLGIGVVALSQAALIVAFALGLAAAVGSDLLRGSAPLVLLCQLLWLVLGYGFYCWLYAAGGSTAERQDQVQTLALPLSIPILIGYIYSITVLTTGNAGLLYRVLAYLPPTAPFCMPVLVSLNQVTWWEFVVSILISLAGTAAMAIFAARIYRRAVLRSGGRVKLGELLRGAH